MSRQAMSAPNSDFKVSETLRSEFLNQSKQSCLFAVSGCWASGHLSCTHLPPPDSPITGTPGIHHPGFAMSSNGGCWRVGFYFLENMDSIPSTIECNCSFLPPPPSRPLTHTIWQPPCFAPAIPRPSSRPQGLQRMQELIFPLIFTDTQTLSTLQLANTAPLDIPAFRTPPSRRPDVAPLHPPRASAPTAA